MSTVALVLDLEYQFSPVQEIEASVMVPALEAHLITQFLTAVVTTPRFEVSLG